MACFFLSFVLPFADLVVGSVLQGPAHLLLTFEHVPVDARKGRAIFAGLFGRLFHRVDWRGCGYATDQTVGWEHVSCCQEKEIDLRLISIIAAMTD